MESATTLLRLALALLIAAQQPNVPDDLRNTAINIANTAIHESLLVIEKPKLLEICDYGETINCTPRVFSKANIPSYSPRPETPVAIPHLLKI